MNNKKIINLTEKETLKVQFEFFEAIFETIKSIVEKNKIEVTYNGKLNNYVTSIKNEIEIPIIALMKAAKDVIDKNHEIYKKFLTHETKRNQIFTKLLSQLTYYEEGTIRQQFNRNSFNDETINAVSELLNIDANILNGKNVKSLVSMTYKFHNCNLNEYFDDIEKHYNNEELEYETYKEEFMLKYDELSSKEKYILYTDFDIVCTAFSFFNHIYEIFNELNEKGQNAYNDIFAILFPDKLVETKFYELNHLKDDNSEYSKTKLLIEKVDAITEENVKNLPLKKAKENILNQINNCAPIYYDIILDNLKLLIDKNSDNRKIALFFTTFSENERELIIKNLNHLNSIPEYRAE